MVWNENSIYNSIVVSNNLKPFFRILSLVFINLLAIFILIRVIDYTFFEWSRHTFYYSAITNNFKISFDLPETRMENTISSIGLNNEEVAVPKPKNTIRILALGDSNTFGWGVYLQDSWVKVLQRELNESGRLDTKIEVINAGIPGADPSMYAQTCNAYYNQLQIDYVLVTFASNDIYDIGSATKPTSFSGNVLDLLIPNLKNIAKKRVQLTDLPSPALNEKYKKESIANLQQKPNLNIDPELKDLLIQGKISSSFVKDGAGDTKSFQISEIPEYENTVLPILKKYINNINSSCGGQKHILGFQYLPAMVLVNKNYFEKLKIVGFDLPDWLNTSNVSDGYFKDSTQNLAPYWSLLNNFRSDGCPGCYYLWNTHLTKIGNQRVAGALTDKVVSRLKELRNK